MAIPVQQVWADRRSSGPLVFILYKLFCGVNNFYKGHFLEYMLFARGKKLVSTGSNVRDGLLSIFTSSILTAVQRPQ